MNHHRLQELLRKWANDSIGGEEELELMRLLSLKESDTERQGFAEDVYHGINDLVHLNKDDSDRIFLQAIGKEPVTETIPRVHRIHFLRTAWFKYAAAIIILFGIGAYLWNTQQKEKSVIAETKTVPVKNDIAPGSNRAILTLSDGRKVELTPLTGKIAETGINIENANGRLEYGKADKVVFNTMATPRGGQYQLILPDGTKVWLNAASSITYPTAFSSNTREVNITGEAYFEVAQNKSKPFIVKTSKENITVLGTSFNVNSYADEPVFKTSLIEGSVKINDRILQPGQAYVNEKIIPTNTGQDIAWKNGYFNMQGADIRSVMRMISRWYDVEVKYKREISSRFYVDISRNTPLADVLKILEATGKVKTDIQGKTIIIQ